MREIKFRAWNNETRSMYKWDELSRNPSSLYNALVGSVYGHDRLQMWSVMQSTSLKDKNGVEIYEGDILEHRSGLVPRGANPIIRKVAKWDKNGARFIGLTGGNVIGNIYENPELLE